MENIIKLGYWDFDSTLMDTPHPNVGKDVWAKHYNTPYPYEGWWGRLESMDLQVFDIKSRPHVHAMFDTYVESGYINNVLTSRQPKFENIISKILDNNNIKVDQIFTAKGKLTKGDIILQQVENHLRLGYNISNIVFVDDRQKEIDAVLAIKSKLQALKIQLTVIKIQSDALD